MSIIKFMQLIRVVEKMNFLVQMVIVVLYDLYPFIFLFCVFIFFFTMVIIIMGADFDAEDYPQVDPFLRILIQVFRNSIGDVNIVDYGKWTPEEGQEASREQKAAMSILWVFWMLNIFIMVIVLLNFLIAEVSTTYTRISEAGSQFIFQKKAEMNMKARQLQNMFGFSQHFQVIALTTAKDESAAGNLAGFTSVIKHDVGQLLGRTKADIVKSLKHLDGLIEKSMKHQEVVEHKIINSLEQKLGAKIDEAMAKLERKIQN